MIPFYQSRFYWRYDNTTYRPIIYRQGHPEAYV